MDDLGRINDTCTVDKDKSKQPRGYAMFKLSTNQNGRRRFTIGNFKGFIAIRKNLSRGFGIQKQRTFNQLQLLKYSICIEKKRPERELWNWV